MTNDMYIEQITSLYAITDCDYIIHDDGTLVLLRNLSANASRESDVLRRNRDTLCVNGTKIGVGK